MADQSYMGLDQKKVNFHDFMYFPMRMESIILINTGFYL